MHLRKYRLSLVCWGLTASAIAGQVDTIQVESSVMHKFIKCVIITPDRYRTNPTARFPVVYLLHGYTHTYKDWIGHVPELTTYADQQDLIMACPDGQDSWYFDSPVLANVRFETYMTAELLPYLDAHYRTMPDKQHRALTGMSMGGHGSLYLAARHPNLYGNAAVLSGVVDFRPFPNNWSLKELLGDPIIYADVWSAHTVYMAVDALQTGDVRIRIDCGTSDFCLDISRSLHQKLVQRGIAHDYIEQPGDHNWDFWRGNINAQLLFFRIGFSQSTWIGSVQSGAWTDNATWSCLCQPKVTDTVCIQPGHRVTITQLVKCKTVWLRGSLYVRNGGRLQQQ